jgi:VanZ family protein
MLQLLLPVYWLLCLMATHLPLPPSAEPMLFLDKVVHFTMYLGLGLLLGRQLLVTGRSPRQTLLVGLAVLAVYGIVDELTQPFFGRGADPLDWLADVAGAAVGLSLLRLLPARWTRPPGP